MIINNSISIDDYTVRAERLQLLSTNIDTYAVVLGITGAKLIAAQSADSDWDDACAKAVVESGQSDEAYETFHQAVEAAAKYYQQAKDHLLTIIYEAGGAPDDFINAYGFNVVSPRKYKKLTAAIEAWKRNHDLLVALPDPRVLPAGIMANVMTHKTTIDTLANTAFIEKQESDSAFLEKQDLFKVQTNLLQFVFTAAVLTWGDDDSKLNLLGFKPKSEIWTPGGGVNPEIGIPEDLAFEIIGADVRVFWHAVVGADEYQLSHTQHPPLFLSLYEGAETEFLHLGPDNGTHYYKVRTKVGDEYGAWSEQIEVEVSVEAPGPPINLILTVGMANDIKATWDSAPGVVYDGCSIYYADVATGDPEPAMPTAPYMDELIVYTFTLPVLASGKTRYVWVTGTKDGAESDPCGPVSIAIT